VARKHEELRAAAIPVAELRGLAESGRDAHRDFRAALAGRMPAVIAEIKKASPSKGVLVEDFRPAELAAAYELGGAAAISVLTDRDFFQGGLAHLQAARANCTIPVLRKDFTVSEYHVHEAAANGADAILLIAAILDVVRMRDYRQLAESLGLSVLVEAHDAAEVDAALESGATIVGVNNRDLRTFRVSLETAVALAPRIPEGVVRVAESGIFTRGDMELLAGVGFRAFLIGEHLVKSGDPAAALKDLVHGW
jgi:indole-3-glycerol phosphate synthase